MPVHTNRGRYSSSKEWRSIGGTAGWRVTDRKDKISAMTVVYEKHFLLPRSEEDCCKEGRRRGKQEVLSTVKKNPSQWCHWIKKIFWDQRHTHAIHTEQQCPSRQNRLSLESFSWGTTWCFAFALPAGISSQMLALFGLQGPVPRLTWRHTADSYSTHFYTLVVKICDPLTLADSTLCSLLQWKERTGYNEARMECLGNKTAGIWPRSIKCVCMCVCSWAKESNKCMSDQADRVLGSCTFNNRELCNCRHRIATVWPVWCDLITLRPDSKAGFTLQALPNYSAFAFFFYFFFHWQLFFKGKSMLMLQLTS